MVTEAALSVVIAVLMAVAVLASYAFAWYSWRRATHPISDRFALLMVADGSWALFALLGHLAPTDTLALLTRAPLSASATLATLFWFMFVIEYTADTEWIPASAEYLIATAVFLYITLFTFNPGGLAYPRQGVDQFGILRVPYEVFGPIMIGYSLFTYALLLITFGLLARFLLRTRNLYRKQAAVIFGVTFAVLVSTVVYVAGLSPAPNLDLTPLFFVVQAVGVGVALYRYDFLDVEPMAAHTLLEELDDPVFVVDTDGRLVDWNAAAASYVEDEHARLSIDDVAIPELTSSITSTDGGTDGDTTTVSTTDPDGSLVTFDVRTTPIEDRYGIVRGRALVLRDITEQESRKRALQTQNERLEEFTGVVSHDLRNPLQVIDGRLELARRTGDLSHIDEASEAVDRMETMLEELLHLAREGQTIDETMEVDLATCCRTAWDGIDTGEATLVVDTDESVMADETRLRQLFENLFRNCVEHGSTGNRTESDDSVEHGSSRLPADEDGGPAVTVTVGSLDEGFYVADDGPGIPEDERDAVFEFGVSHSEDGTGFGLAIVKRIAEAHGWTVAYADSEAGGARFEVTPLVTSES